MQHPAQTPADPTSAQEPQAAEGTLPRGILQMTPMVTFVQEPRRHMPLLLWIQ